MNTNDFIHNAINAGEARGVASLNPDQRFIWLISEAECLCDMEGIDAFLNRYSPDWMGETADAFQAIGATEIARVFQQIADGLSGDEALLDHLNELVTSRSGYNYEAIKQEVNRRLSGND